MVTLPASAPGALPFAHSLAGSGAGAFWAGLAGAAVVARSLASAWASPGRASESDKVRAANSPSLNDIAFIPLSRPSLPSAFLTSGPRERSSEKIETAGINDWLRRGFGSNATHRGKAGASDRGTR